MFIFGKNLASNGFIFFMWIEFLSLKYQLIFYIKMVQSLKPYIFY